MIMIRHLDYFMMYLIITIACWSYILDVTYSYHIFEGEIHAIGTKAWHVAVHFYIWSQYTLNLLACSIIQQISNMKTCFILYTFSKFTYINYLFLLILQCFTLIIIKIYGIGPFMFFFSFSSFPSESIYWLPCFEPCRV